MVVYATYDFSDAHIVAGRLEVEGIKTMVYRQAGAGALGITIGSIGEITVLVHPSEEARALAILGEGDQDLLPDSTDDIVYYMDEDDDDIAE